MTAPQSRARVKGSLLRLKPLMPSRRSLWKATLRLARPSIMPAASGPCLINQVEIAESQGMQGQRNGPHHAKMPALPSRKRCDCAPIQRLLPTMMLRRLFGECFAFFCAIMLGLAAGAVWLVPTVLLRRPLPELALPVGWLLAIAIRQ